MTVEEKINFLKKAIKKSFCVQANGNMVLFNEHETEEHENTIYFDDITGDDYAFHIDLTEIKDIELNNGNFKLIFENGNDMNIRIAVIKKYEW